MPERSRTMPFAIAALVAVACGSAFWCGGAGGLGGYQITPIRSGALYPSKGDRCGIRFENLNFQEASAKYESLGLVTLTGTGSDEFTDGMKADVEKSACHMGGDVVSVNASTTGMFQFMVWRAK
ncbi:MAG: hypothetical protein ACRELB_19680 [Polyangiaceae bacterium]